MFRLTQSLVRVLTVLTIGGVTTMLPMSANAQATPATPPPAARPQDVASLDAIIAALYDVISGPAGQQRDWDRFRSLFAPGARLIPTGRRQDGTHSMRVFTPDEYATNATPALSNGFFEREIGRTTEQYGGIVQAFSTYESRRAASDAQPFARGINSIQLVNDGKRWWVVTVLWEAERPDNHIPERFIGKPKPNNSGGR
jgi:hypothetical protein